MQDEVGVRDFAMEVLSNPLPVLVSFSTDSCGACIAARPALQDVAREYSGEMVVMECNLDRHPVLADIYRIASAPTLIMFRAGAEHGRLEGPRTRSNIARLVEDHLEAAP